MIEEGNRNKKKNTLIFLNWPIGSKVIGFFYPIFRYFPYQMWIGISDIIKSKYKHIKCFWISYDIINKTYYKNL